MKRNINPNRLFCALCWLGTAMTAGLELYMLHLMRKYPTIESFESYVRILGVMLLVWIGVTAFFTVKARMGSKK